MNRLVVGDEPCSFNKLVILMEKSVSAYELLENWKKFARALDTPIDKMRKLKNDLQLDKLGGWCVVEDLLIHWRARCGTTATITKLLDILELDCGWKDIADHLWQHYSLEISEQTCWQDLDKRTQSKILERKVEFFGWEKTLNEILDQFCADEKENILEKSLTGPLILELLSNDVTQLSREKIPKEPKYYIPRTLSSRRRIDEKIFKEKCSDIFVVDNIEILEFYEVSGGQQLVRSREQLRTVSSRFIFLEFPEDFDQICEKTGNISVHLLKYTDQKFLWMKTKGDLHVIQQHLHAGQDEIPEIDFFTGFTNDDNRTICIADNPGMGKSVLLANLYRIRKSQEWSRLTMFLNFTDFAKMMNPTNDEKAIKEITLALADQFSQNNLGKNILTLMLQRKQQKVEIFIDGFDEIPLHQVQTATNVLKQLVLEIPLIRVFATTRLHRREQLERALGSLSYNILPFQEQDQVNCMIRYWFHESQIPVNPNLKKFTSTLVKTVRDTVKSNGCEISGFPLQCRMLAEIYEQDAKKHANAKSKKIGIVFTVDSVFDMYKILLKMRFEKVCDEKRPIAKRFHQMAALNLLFSESASIFQQYLPIEQKDLLDLDDINGVGILVTEEGRNACHFLHQTYAEFILADFLVELLQAETTGETQNEVKIDVFKFILNQVLQLSKSDAGIRFNTPACDVDTVMEEMSKCASAERCKTSWKRVASALNMSLEDVVAVSANLLSFSNSDDDLDRDAMKWLLVQWTKNSALSPYLADLINALSNLQFDEIADSLKLRFYENQWEHGNLCFFLENGLINSKSTIRLSDFTNLENIVENKMVDRDWLNVYDILKCSLHSNYGTLFELFSRFYRDVKSLKFLQLDEYKWKALVIEATKHSSVGLVKFCCKFVKQMSGEGLHEMKFLCTIFDSLKFTPLHVACERGEMSIFLFFLSEFGSRVCKMKCLLHYCIQCSLENCDDVIKQKLQIVEKLLQMNSAFIEELEPQTQRSPIVMPRVHYEILECLIENGANVFAGDVNGHTVAHKASIHYSPDDFHKLATLLLKNGCGDVFKVFNKTIKITPLHYALNRKSILPDTLQLIASRTKTNYNNPNVDGLTELFYAVSGFQSIETLKVIVKFGGDPKTESKTKETVLHFAAVCGHVEAIEYFVLLQCRVDSRDINKQTPLHVAIIFGYRNVDHTVQVLLKKNANVNAPDRWGRTPLDYAEDKDFSWKLTPSTLELMRTRSNEGTL